jgi:hypothetical protein
MHYDWIRLGMQREEQLFVIGQYENCHPTDTVVDPAQSSC